MIDVQFPPPHFKIEKRGEAPYIFDPIRKTWLSLTEEEWVRQNMVAYLTISLQYPKEAIALEKAIMVNGLKKRFDILIYNRSHEPWMLVECKAPQVELNDKVLQQALRYNIAVPVRWVVITNGAQTTAWGKTEGKMTLMQSLPVWNE